MGEHHVYICVNNSYIHVCLTQVLSNTGDSKQYAMTLSDFFSYQEPSKGGTFVVPIQRVSILVIPEVYVFCLFAPVL